MAQDGFQQGPVTIPDVVTDHNMVAIARQMMDDEKLTCDLCRRGYPAPHFRGYIKQGVLYQKDCGSNSRRFSPRMMELVGNSHCTCDTCF